MPPLDTDAVLRAEANSIHSASAAIPDGIAGKELYRALHARNSSALCLSGGGIRSASFALGVVEALAVHPRPGANKQAGDESQSLLRQFHYLSTVSGGGYIGSWLSAWIARAGYPAVWRRLSGERDHPDEEPGEISWLRAYSNYLTPRLGLFSADTWTAIALYVRNLVLNWLVILPAAVLALLFIKTFAILGFWATAGVYSISRYAVVGFVVLSVILLMYALRFALLNRPSRFLGPVAAPKKIIQKTQSTDAHRDEAARVSEGADAREFTKRCLLPALFSAFLLAVYLIIRGPKLSTWSSFPLILMFALVGAAVYALAWVWAWPPRDDYSTPSAAKPRHYWLRDFFSWVAAGIVYGGFIGAGVYLLANYDLWLVIGNIDQGDPHVSSWTGYYLIALIYGVPWIITAQLTAEMVFVGLTSWQPNSDPDREWFGRSTGYFTVVALMWFVVTFLVLIAAEVTWSFIKSYDSAKYLTALTGVGSAVFSTLMGKSGRSSATEQKDKSGLIMRIAVPLAAVLFLIILGLAISYLLDYLLFGESLIYSGLLGSAPASEIPEELLWLVIGFAIAAAVAAGAWLYVNINRFSIHALYRNRLIRAYLGASNPDRAANPFTGFDESDNVAMANLWSPTRPTWQPFHVVNIALNVVASGRLAWQERKAEPFTATPLHCGTATFSGTTAHSLGYRPTADYASGITLGTALAISGAAASPNMGYHTSPIVSLLLALFNVRLGWWLGNPGAPGEESYRSEGPKIAILPFIAEMFGQTTDTRRYVYLSDGGHFENLGLYEMIRRRCRCIVVSDAGCDPNYGFEDLGNAVRKIAIDLGVGISFGNLRALKARTKDNATIEGSYYALGVIDYQTSPEQNPAAENGYILYIKPGYHGTEGADIVAYATANPAFPHETTADQFFSESQFESYRMLGFEIMDGVLKEAAENVDTIKDSGILTPPPSRNILCDLIKALDAEVLATAEAARKAPPTKLAQVVGALDDDVIAELRTALQRPPEKPGAA